MRVNKSAAYSYFLSLATALLLIFIITSCSLKKHVTKSETKEETKENIHATETETTTTTFDTSVLIPGDSISNFMPIENLLNGDTAVTEDGDFVTTTHLDKKTKTVKTKTVQKPKVVPVTGTITTVKQSTVITEKESSKEIRKKEKDVKRFNILPFIIPFCILLLIIFGLWVLKKMYFK